MGAISKGIQGYVAGRNAMYERMMAVAQYQRQQALEENTLALGQARMNRYANLDGAGAQKPVDQQDAADYAAWRKDVEAGYTSAQLAANHPNRDPYTGQLVPAASDAPSAYPYAPAGIGIARIGRSGVENAGDGAPAAGYPGASASALGAYALPAATAGPSGPGTMPAPLLSPASASAPSPAAAPPSIGLFGTLGQMPPGPPGPQAPPSPAPGPAVPARSATPAGSPSPSPQPFAANGQMPGQATGAPAGMPPTGAAPQGPGSSFQPMEMTTNPYVYANADAHIKGAVASYDLHVRNVVDPAIRQAMYQSSLQELQGYTKFGKPIDPLSVGLVPPSAYPVPVTDQQKQDAATRQEELKSLSASLNNPSLGSYPGRQADVDQYNKVNRLLTGAGPRQFPVPGMTPAQQSEAQARAASLAEQTRYHDADIAVHQREVNTRAARLNWDELTQGRGKPPSPFDLMTHLGSITSEIQDKRVQIEALRTRAQGSTYTDPATGKTFTSPGSLTPAQFQAQAAPLVADIAYLAQHRDRITSLYGNGIEPPGPQMSRAAPPAARARPSGGGNGTPKGANKPLTGTTPKGLSFTANPVSE
jgi:hypothetical protein